MNKVEQPCLPGMEKYAEHPITRLLNSFENNANNFDLKFIPLIELIETYQGEGPNCGKKMVLSRFKYCNKHCPFCDTWKKMLDSKTNLKSLNDINELLKSSPNLMITGGEPTLDNVVHNSDELSQLHCTFLMCAFLNYRFLDIETNGFNLDKLTKSVDYITNRYSKNINISWSPKFIDSNDYSINIDKVKMCKSNNVTMKVVIGGDMEEYVKFVYDSVEKCGWDNNRLYLMPKGTTLDEINHSMKKVLHVASDLSCNISTRLHIIHNFE